jgi:hypothetical protein
MAIPMELRVGDLFELQQIYGTSSSDSQPDTQLNFFSNVGLNPQVWSFNNPEGQSWEYKVNCDSNFSTLDTCFLWDMDQVNVTTPNGQKISLQKDFEFNSYSNETTRRWVLYGPDGGGLPISGTYIFNYIKNGRVVFTQNYHYTQAVVPYPTNVVIKQIGDDLHVSWQPPEGVTPDMWYKVIIYAATSQFTTSLIFPANSNDIVLPSPPLKAGVKYNATVVLYNDTFGYARSEFIPFTWTNP